MVNFNKFNNPFKNLIKSSKDLNQIQKDLKALTSMRISGIDKNTKEGRKLIDQIYKARNARSAGAQAELAFMQANPQLGTRLKSGNIQFSSPEAISGLNAARLAAYKDLGYGLSTGESIQRELKKVGSKAGNLSVKAKDLGNKAKDLGRKSGDLGLSFITGNNKIRAAEKAFNKKHPILRVGKDIVKYPAALAAIPALAGAAEWAYNGYNNLRNDSDETTFDDVKQDQNFIDWLYKSGGENAPAIRRFNNFNNVAGNYLYGLFKPHGNTPLDLGEGTERQAVAASLYSLINGGDGSINDTAHAALGGKHGDSGSSFHGQNSDEKGFWGKVSDQFANALNLPYHNIYGQSAGTGFNENGFYSHGDNYTFNNVWGAKPNGKVGVVQVLDDGEGNSGLKSSIKAGIDAYKSGVTGVQPLMETVASLRGVDTKRHSDVSDIPIEQLNKWAREYNRQKRKK